MCKFELILKHFDLSKRKSRSVKKVIRRTENDKKTKNARQNDTEKIKQSSFISS
jgi:hypothetical protein